MFDFFRSLIQSDSLSPHGICLLWRPELVWTHAISDAVIGVAYFSIPLVLISFVMQRRDIHFSWVVWCFAAFILACGTTHFLSIWTLWVPDYGIEAIVKAMAAIVSLLTACALWPLLPRAVAMPSAAQLEEANRALVARIAERDEALEALKQATAERDRTEAMLRQSQKLEAIGKLTGGLAHDFNNMLNIVVAHLERVERSLPEESGLRDPIAKAMTGAERAAAITHKLLAFAGQQPLLTKVVSVNEVVKDALTVSRFTLPSGVRLDVRLEPDIWLVDVDQSQLQNAVLNLLHNARDAMIGSGTIRLSTRNILAGEGEESRRLSAESQFVVVEVADTGTGMPPDLALRAFDPFFTTKPLGHGTGLGLSQVLGFAQQSGGDATISSRIGEGTRVRLYLPRRAETVSISTQAISLGIYDEMATVPTKA